MALLGLFFVGCDAQDARPAVSAASQDAKEALAKPDSPTLDSWSDPTEETAVKTEPPERTDGTAPSTEDPGCYYSEGLNVEVAAVAQTHAQEMADCSEEHPLAGADPGGPGYGQLYWSHNLCQHEANLRLSTRRDNVIENCFDENTEWFHEEDCAIQFGHEELFDCVNGKAHTAANWDGCAALRDTRYDDAIASGECSV